MKTYIADIIPKIQKFSQKLDDLAMLVNQHWVVLDELVESKTIYIFRNNGELLIAKDGIVEKARWEHLGPKSLLIDLKEKSYLFRHGFFDKNILALKVDSKEEYGFLINESKYEGELNSISSVIEFLTQNYYFNPEIIDNQSKSRKYSSGDKEITYLRDGYSFKTGSFRVFLLRLSKSLTFNFYQKKSNNEYFVILGDGILVFPNIEACVKYIEDKMG